MLKDSLPKIITDRFPGPKAKKLIERRNCAVPSAIKCVYPVAIKRGEGAMIEDLDGNIFLDWIGGVGVLNVGYSQPEIIDAVKAQSEKYFHGMFNIVTHEGYVALAEKIASVVPVKGEKKKVFFANSGAEADENAVKIAKAYTGRPNIIVFSGAFHGRTMMTMAMTSKKAYSVGMGPFPDGVYRAEFPYLYRRPEGMSEESAIAYYVEKFKRVFEECSPAEYVAAVVIEPLQGEGGFIPCPLEYIKAISKICAEKGILLIADEVQSGWCRTGRMFASQYWQEAGVQPDIIATAKSIAAGLPLSAIAAREEIMEAVPAGTIGGTYCGNPLACAAALKTIEIMQRESLAERSCKIGKTVTDRYMSLLEKYDVVGDVRGLGAMVGIEFVTDKKSKTPNPQYHVAHGEANYAMLTAVYKKYMQIKSDGAINELNEILAASLDCKPDNVYEKLEALLDYLIKKQPLHVYGMKEHGIESFADTVLETQTRLLANNFVPLDRQDLIDIYKSVF